MRNDPIGACPPLDLRDCWDSTRLLLTTVTCLDYRPVSHRELYVQYCSHENQLNLVLLLDNGVIVVDDAFESMTEETIMALTSTWLPATPPNQKEQVIASYKLNAVILTWRHRLGRRRSRRGRSGKNRPRCTHSLLYLYL